MAGAYSAALPKAAPASAPLRWRCRTLLPRGDRVPRRQTPEGPEQYTRSIMRIGLSSVLVDAQAKALAFYTEKVGFEKGTDILVGEHRWMTVISRTTSSRSYEELKERGVVFRGAPQEIGEAVGVLFEDTCGNLISLVQPG